MGSGSSDLKNLEIHRVEQLEGDLALLPNEVMEYVLTLLDLRDIGAIECLNRYWHRLLSPFWKLLYVKHCPYFDPLLFSRVEKDPLADWKDLYKSQITLGWRLGNTESYKGQNWEVTRNGFKAKASRYPRPLALEQRVMTQRGIWRGKHRVTFTLEKITWGVAVGISCRSHSVYPDRHCLMMFADGCIGRFMRRDTQEVVDENYGKQIIGEKGRIKGALKAGDSVTVSVNLDKKVVKFKVNNQLWCVVSDIHLHSDPLLREPFRFVIETKVSERVAIPTKVRVSA